jgi:N-acyl-D-amino-acid deacylase
MISMPFLHSVVSVFSVCSVAARSVVSVCSVALRSVVSVSAVVALSAVSVAACGPPVAFDLVIRGGSVFDGDGSPAKRADVGIKGDRITFVGDLSGHSSAREIDATGLTVAPGFIDVHGQSGTTLLADGHGESHIRQGVTTEIIGEGGSPAFWTPEDNDADTLRPFGIVVDWAGLDGYFRRLQERGIAMNVGTLVPTTAAREGEAAIDRAMRGGAFGVSSTIVSPRETSAETPGPIPLARVAARHGGIYATRFRGDDIDMLEAIDNAIEVGRDANVPVVILDLTATARGRMADMIAKLNAAGNANVRVSATMHPYATDATDEDVKRGLQWSAISIGSDSAALRTGGVLSRGSAHPRAYGTFPRVLGKYVREERAIELADAVRRMTSLAARQVGIDNRGYIRPDLYADIVVFDPATISDTATFEQPHQYPTGIAYVIVNGVPVVDPKGLTGARPGRAIYGPGRPARQTP